MQFKKNGLKIEEGIPPVRVENGERLTRNLIKKKSSIPLKRNVLEDAKSINSIYMKSGDNSYHKVAKETGVSRVRICQMLNLLKLAPEIQEYLGTIKDPKILNFFSERRLRPLTLIKEKETQISVFQELLKNKVIFIPTSISSHSI